MGTGTVLVARKPFKVHTWVDRGYYRVGEVIKSNFSARTLDGKPVEGSGELTLYEVKYKDGKLVVKGIVAAGSDQKNLIIDAHCVFPEN